MAEENQKRQYHKPVVIKVELAAEEVLAVGCKTPSGGGTTGRLPPLRCKTTGCFAVGS